MLCFLLQELDDKYGFLSSDLQWVTHIDNERKVRGLWTAAWRCGQQGSGVRSLHAVCCGCSFLSEKGTQEADTVCKPMCVDTGGAFKKCKPMSV